MEITLNPDRLEEEVKKTVEELFSREDFSSLTIRTALQYVHKAICAVIGSYADKMVKEWIFNSLPITFHPSDIPFEWWLGKNPIWEPSKMAICSFEGLWNALPEDRKKDKTALISRYLYVLSSINHYYLSARQKGSMVEVRLFPFEGNKQGQMMANFWVKDLGKPVKDSYNFHGQNTSQWLFAGCILSSADGDFSIHT